MFLVAVCLHVASFQGWEYGSNTDQPKRAWHAQDQAQLVLSAAVDGISKRLAAAVKSISKLSDADLEAAADAAEQDENGDYQVGGSFSASLPSSERRVAPPRSL